MLHSEPAKSAKGALATTRPAKRAPSAALADAGGSAMQRILRHWREAVPDDRMAHLVKDATRSFDRALQERLAAHAVSFGHWVFLRILWERDGLTQSDLSREAGVMEPTTFAALKRMETRGYIRRRPFADNRRKVHIFLTARGRSLKAVLVPLAEDINRMALAGVPAADVATTRRTLLTVLENLAREEEPSTTPDARESGTHAATRSRSGR